jgi:hypothetical protein
MGEGPAAHVPGGEPEGTRKARHRKYQLSPWLAVTCPVFMRNEYRKISLLLEEMIM